MGVDLSGMPGYIQSPFMASAGTLPEIDAARQAGEGADAAVTGQTFNVFRIGPQTNGSALSGTPVYLNFPVRFGREAKQKIENDAFSLLVMHGICDGRALQFGDILVETGYQARPGDQFIFAQYRPPQDWIFVRAENISGIQRPHPDGGAASQQPSSGWIAQNSGQKLYGGITPFNREILCLDSGLFAFKQPNEITNVASVPVGIQPRSRTRDRHEPDLPTQIAESEFYGYVPPLPGVEIAEIDVIKAMHADNYETRGVFSSDESGLQGYILQLRKLAS